jgi:alpha,alpha-trehalase
MKSPDQIFGQLFIDLHLSGIWHDGKVISDSTPLFEVDVILTAYEKQKNNPGFDLKVFFENHFEYFSVPTQDFKSDTSMSVSEHISRLWSHLSRSSDLEISGSSLIPLPNPYVVPGGRFNEIYYWDSYFTMLGLEVSQKLEMVESMVDNFSWQISSLGFIPNGNRSYFLGRSQPPFFSLMVALLARQKGKDIYIKYSNSLQKEYDFWMSHDKDELKSTGCSQHVVNCGNVLLNRYYDKFNSARPEMYGDDVRLTSNLSRNANDIYSNLRSACESGWDFSSRWLGPDLTLSTIHALDIIPIDLNCLLYHLEFQISKSNKVLGNIEESEKFLNLAEIRKNAINEYFWNSEKQFYFDYNHIEKIQTSVESLAAVFPLFFNLANDKQAKSVADKIQSDFLMPGGVLTTTIESGQQWDAPNGWAPLQYLTVKALENYGFNKLATEIKSRWLALNDRVFKNSGKMLEKYNVVDVSLMSGGGEYPVQDGFGWTNGVYLNFLNSK